MSAADTGFHARAGLPGGLLTDADILRLELDRARHALAYLKARLGNDRMRDLVADDTTVMSSQVQAWMRESAGAWQSASMELVVSGPPAAIFKAWYADLFARDRQEILRAGHPEHFVNHSSGAGGAEVIENVGETDLPWRICYEPVADAELPVPWDCDHPVRFASQLRDPDGQLMGYNRLARPRTRGARHAAPAPLRDRVPQLGRGRLARTQRGEPVRVLRVQEVKG